MANPAGEVVRTVLVQFSFSNDNIIPPVLLRMEKETPDGRTKRKAITGGSQVIQPTKGCSIVDFIDQLNTAGYELTNAVYQERIDSKDSSGKRTYHMLRFVFCLHEFAVVSDEFMEVRDKCFEALQQVCMEALWRVRTYSNPFYDENGEEVEGVRAWSINLEVRKPLFDPDGQPVVERRKNDGGDHVGDKPDAIFPEYILSMRSGRLGLVKF